MTEGYKNVLLEIVLLKESIAYVVIQEHYEQRFLDLKYIFYKTILVRQR